LGCIAEAFGPRDFMGADIFGLGFEDESSRITMVDTYRLLSAFVFVEEVTIVEWLEVVMVLMYITDVTWRKYYRC
jgi:hypothetical protein